MSDKYKGRLLIVDDDQDAIDFWSVALAEHGFRIESAQTLEQMQEICASFSVDAVLLDLELGDVSGLDGLRYLAKETPYTKVFILTGHGSIETAINAMKEGAHGYITKDTAPEKIAEQVESAISRKEAYGQIKENELFKIGMIGRSKSFNRLCASIAQLKDVDSTVLIHGESGTGKEVAARALHKLSNRANQRFEAINCAAIPEALLESELFGHKRGAFTDAKSDRKGIFELCSEGTLMLDEIGDMPLSLQAKILRVLQEKVIVPVGGSTAVKINTRVIAATHRDLLDEIEKGRFREDLYYRLTVVPITVPSLRNRKDDIPILVEHFIDEFNTRFAKSIKVPNNAVMSRIMAYDWPGNIRELRNAIERAIVLAPKDEIHIEDMFKHLGNDIAQPAKKYGSMSIGRTNDSGPALIADDVFDMPLSDAKQRFEKAYIRRLLEKTGGNITATSKKAGRYRADVYRLLEKYELNHQEYKY